MEKFATLTLEGQTIKLPIVIGSEGERAIDISALRKETGYITLDPGYTNTGSCKSSITFVDGENGVLRYRGIPVEELAEHSTFVETAYLLMNGELPTRRELNRFSITLNDNSLVHEDMRKFFQNFPRMAHPMGILSSMVNAVQSFYPELEGREEMFNITVARLLAKVRTMASMSYKIARGHRIIYPRHDLTYCANFLNMMFDSPVRPYVIDEDIVRALDVFLILHTDHEQNCSTSAVRMVASSQANIYASISAGVSALWGPLHGGANQAVINMLTTIHENGGDPAPFVKRAKDKEDPFRLMGFGHRVYKTYDPRAKILKKLVDILLSKHHRKDPLLPIARQLEEIALSDSYFVDKNLYPNVDFYSGILLRTIGIPTNMFTVMFALGRLPGWITHWIENLNDPDMRIHRPRQIYMGQTKRRYMPLEERGGDATLKKRPF
jgi:citrate synthase